MEDLSMFQRPKIVALEDEKPGTYGTVLIYPLDRLVECRFAGYMLNIYTWELSLSQLQPLFFSQPKSSLALTRWENDPNPILGNPVLTLLRRLGRSAHQAPSSWADWPYSSQSQTQDIDSIGFRPQPMHERLALS
ncbi:hypothetical protein PIB30_035310 [Stylosanthes scabra]|uniref:Uncharacterized protein n=1 Tax=Stylosanthes scabra TaxID=79078 RepID=A0ABU6QCM1_9FABA|nr:hypothetical protein [Stylosanthes scabra]